MSNPRNNSLYLKRISESLLNLPTLPTIHARLIELVDHPRTTPEHVAELLREDQSLTARLLKMCNSSYYGLRSEVSSVERAIVLLGFETVREMSLGISVIGQFDTVGLQGLFDLNRFWEHGASVAVISKYLAKRFYPDAQKPAFLAGLLHDIGKLVLIQYMQEDFRECLELAKREEKFLYEIEEELLGAHHGQVGEWLGKKWKFPKWILLSTAHHHRPWEAKDGHELLAVVVFADLLAQHMKLGQSGNVKPLLKDEQLREYLLKFFPLSDEDFFPQLGEAIQAELERSESMVRQLLRSGNA